MWSKSILYVQNAVRYHTRIVKTEKSLLCFRKKRETSKTRFNIWSKQTRPSKQERKAKLRCTSGFRLDIIGRVNHIDLGSSVLPKEQRRGRPSFIPPRGNRREHVGGNKAWLEDPQLQALHSFSNLLYGWSPSPIRPALREREGERERGWLSENVMFWPPLPLTYTGNQCIVEWEQTRLNETLSHDCLNKHLMINRCKDSTSELYRPTSWHHEGAHTPLVRTIFNIYDKDVSFLVCPTEGQRQNQKIYSEWLVSAYSADVPRELWLRDDWRVNWNPGKSRNAADKTTAGLKDFQRQSRDFGGFSNNKTGQTRIRVQVECVKPQQTAVEYRQLGRWTAGEGLGPPGVPINPLPEPCGRFNLPVKTGPRYEYQTIDGCSGLTEVQSPERQKIKLEISAMWFQFILYKLLPFFFISKTFLNPVFRSSIHSLSTLVSTARKVKCSACDSTRTKTKSPVASCLLFTLHPFPSFSEKEASRLARRSNGCQGSV